MEKCNGEKVIVEVVMLLLYLVPLGKLKILLLGGDRVGTHWDVEATRG